MYQAAEHMLVLELRRRVVVSGGGSSASAGVPPISAAAPTTDAEVTNPRRDCVTRIGDLPLCPRDPEPGGDVVRRGASVVLATRDLSGQCSLERAQGPAPGQRDDHVRHVPSKPT